MNTDNIKKALDLSGDAYQNSEVVTDNTEKMNYLMPTFENLYKELNPQQVTLKNNIIYLNSSQDVNDNAYLFELQDIYREASGTHTACLNTKVDMTIGNGLKPIVDDVATQEFLDNNNRMGQNWQQIWERICFDYNLTGMFALQTLWSKEGKVVEVVHNDISTIRGVAPDEKDTAFLPIINTWALSSRWAEIVDHNRLTPNNSAIMIANFNTKTWAEDGGRQLMVHKKYISGMFPYGLPDYQSVIKYIELDNQLAKFHLGKVSQGFFPNVIVQLSGNPSDEDKNLFKSRFNRRYVGPDKSKILFVWSEMGEDAPKIIQFSTNDDSQIFVDLNTILTQKILTAHRIPPELASIPTANASLGGDANKMAVSHAYVVQNVIKPIQKSMLQSINQIFRQNGLMDVSVDNDSLMLDTENNKENTAETN